MRCGLMGRDLADQDQPWPTVGAEGDAAPTCVKTRPEDVAVKAKAVTARVPAAMAMVKICLIGEAPFRRMRHGIVHLTSTD